MIQFKHYHDPKMGYADAVSKDCTSEDKRIFQTISSFKRSRDKETCFTYLPVNKKAYLMQATKDGIYEYFHGLAQDIADFRETRVAEYIDQLEKEHKSSSGQDGVLPDGKLPLRCKEFGLSIARGLKPIFAEVIDALVYGTKPVVLVGNDTASLIKYVKVTLSLLPVSYANSIGFSVCPADLPSFFASGTGTAADNIKLVATDKKVTASDSRFVLNVDEYEPTSRKLGAYAEAIKNVSDMLVSGSGERLNHLVRSVCPSFREDGTVDEDQLEIAICMYNFDSERNPENASDLLRVLPNDKTSVITKFTVVDAIEELLKKDSLSEDEESLISEARKNPEINEIVKDVFGKYAFEKILCGKKVSDMYKDDVSAYAASISDDMIDEESELFSPAFSAKRNSEVVSLFASAYNQTKKIAFLKLLSSYTDIIKTYNYSGQNGESFDDSILYTALKYEQTEKELIGAIILSCYDFDVVSSNGARAKTKQRISALRNLIDKKTADKKEKIEYILELKGALENISDSLGKEIRGPEDFEFLPSDYISEIVSGIDFGTLLEIVNENKVDLSSYADLQIAVLEKLSSLEEVKKNVTVESNISDYELFIENYEREIESRNIDGGIESIRAHIESIKDSLDLQRSILSYRCNFVVGEYDTIPFAEKCKIARDAKNSSDSQKTYEIKSAGRNTPEKDDIKEVFSKKDTDEKSFNEKQKIAELISKVLRELGPGGAGKTSTLNATYFIYSYIFGVFFVLLSAVIIEVIPILSAVLLGTNIFARIVEFTKFYHIIAVMYVGGLNMVGYLVRWSSSNHDRKGSLKKACISTLLFGVLPIFLYAAAYIFTYILV